MSFKSKLLNILTFGHINRKAKKEAEKLAGQKNDQLTLNTIELPEIDILIHTLGGSENIEDVTSTISTITFKILDFNKVDAAHLQTISKRGVIKSNETITLIVGDCAENLKQRIVEYKNK